MGGSLSHWLQRDGGPVYDVVVKKQDNAPAQYAHATVQRLEKQELYILFAFHSNYGRICSHFGDIQRQTMA